MTGACGGGAPGRHWSPCKMQLLGEKANYPALSYSLTFYSPLGDFTFNPAGSQLTGDPGNPTCHSENTGEGKNASKQDQHRHGDLTSAGFAYHCLLHDLKTSLFSCFSFLLPKLRKRAVFGFPKRARTGKRCN